VNENTNGRKANIYDGTDDYVLHDAHAVARVAANDTVGTYTAWIYLDNADSDAAILSAGDNNATNEFMMFAVDSNKKLWIFLQQGGATKFSVRETTGSIPLKTWTHVAIVQNGTRPILYVNGLAITMTDATSTDLTFWYDELTLTDKFAIGTKESNATHTNDWPGAIGQVKYWNEALTATQILADKNRTDYGTPALNITMEDDGTTDSGSGADNGTLTGHAHYGGYVSAYSQAIARNITGHTAETINTIDKGNGNYESVIRRGD